MRPGAAIPFHKLHFAHALVGPVSPGCINQKIPIAAILSFLFFFEDRTAPRQRGLARKVVSGKGLKHIEK